MIEVLELHQEHFWEDRVKAFYGWYTKSGSKTAQDAWTWEGQDNQKWSTSRGSFKRAQSLPANPADRTDPIEQGLRWKDLGPINLDESYPYPGKESDPPCPVEKKHPSPSSAQASAPAASSSAAPGIPIKAAPSFKNPSMASAPGNAPFPNTQGADPWARHHPRSQ